MKARVAQLAGGGDTPLGLVCGGGTKLRLIPRRPASKKYGDVALILVEQRHAKFPKTILSITHNASVPSTSPGQSSRLTDSSLQIPILCKALEKPLQTGAQILFVRLIVFFNPQSV